MEVVAAYLLSQTDVPPTVSKHFEAADVDETASVAGVGANFRAPTKASVGGMDVTSMSALVRAIADMNPGKAVLDALHIVEVSRLAAHTLGAPSGLLQADGIIELDEAARLNLQIRLGTHPAYYEAMEKAEVMAARSALPNTEWFEGKFKTMEMLSWLHGALGCNMSRPSSASRSASTPSNGSTRREQRREHARRLARFQL